MMSVESASFTPSSIITGSLPRGLSLRTWIGEVALMVSNGMRL